VVIFLKKLSKKVPMTHVVWKCFFYFLKTKRVSFCPKNSLGEQGFWNFYPTRLSQVKIYLFIGSPSQGETKICSFYVVLKFEEIILG
jgi:hypothetical protein